MKFKFLFAISLITLLMSSCAKEAIILPVDTPAVEDESFALNIQSQLQELDVQLHQLQESRKVKGYADLETFEKLMAQEDKLMEQILENKEKMTSGNIIYVPGDYPHLGSALNNAAQPGDIIIVEAASYDYDFGEVIVQNHTDVRILADDSNGPVIITGRFRYQNSSNILVRGFTVHPNEFQNQAFWTGGSIQHGMRIIGNAVDFLVNVPFDMNRFECQGVSMKGDNYFIKNNTFIVDGDFTEYGINMEGDGNLIKGNRCEGTQIPSGNSSGIRIEGTGCLVKRNECMSAEEGVRIDGGSDNCMVVQNECTNNNIYGIFVAGTNTIVNDNMAMNNGTCDIFASAAATGSTESGNTANCIQGF